jgi:hypothetical protein
MQTGRKEISALRGVGLFCSITSEELRIWYVLNNLAQEWPFSREFVAKDMIQRNMPEVSKDTIIVLCGPLGDGISSKGIW